MYTGVKLGCILRCIYNNGGGDGGNLRIDFASAVARTDPGSIEADLMHSLAKETFGYFYQNQPVTFSESRNRLWMRMTACVRALPLDPPYWFNEETRLMDVVSLEAVIAVLR